jgi:2-dehydro-3-deoxy-D-arabinonate dehydratase
MKIYKTTKGICIESEGSIYSSAFTSWDSFINQPDLYNSVSAGLSEKNRLGNKEILDGLTIQAPIHSQEIWAAGVTYTRSRDARMEESKDAGGGSFYDMVYDAVRPELFFKATPYRCVGTGDNVRIRKDSTWNVPEPELTLVINNTGNIVGYTIGNDMSSRSIEGENPLYLPQAKCYDGSAAVGPCVYVSSSPISPETKINMQIIRGRTTMYAEEIAISKMKRRHMELVDFLFRECTFPFGCLLMTGTCLVPPNDFTLQSADVIIIRIDHIGELKNTVA